MGGHARLNLLLTPPPLAGAGLQDSQPWHKTLAHLLLPLGVRTFEATSGEQAVHMIEQFPIHLAVVDTRLPNISGLNVLQLIQKLRDQAPPPGEPADAAPPAFHLHMKVEEHAPSQEGGVTRRRIEVRFDARPAQRPGPAVILIAPPPPQQDPQLLQEALKFNAFSVLSEPVDVNLALDVMARALKRFHQNQWPV
jgi:CheY-like chemotaxis protein